MAKPSPKYSSFRGIEFEIYGGVEGRGNLSVCFIMKIYRISSIAMQNISANDLHNLWSCLYRQYACLYRQYAWVTDLNILSCNAASGHL